MTTPEEKAADCNARSTGRLPGLLGIEFLSVTAERVSAQLPIRTDLLAPNGFLHAASVIALADTACGYGSLETMPKGATGFTTIELKSNFLGTAREGAISCEATPQHLGRTTQIWDATVTHDKTSRIIALFRCTQMILRPST